MTHTEATARLIEAARAFIAITEVAPINEAITRDRLAWGLRYNARKALDALDSTPDSGGGWRPIAEAPKDGTFILVAFESGLVTILQYCQDGYWRPDAYDTFETRQPTHWQPLPAPPTQEPK